MPDFADRFKKLQREGFPSSIGRPIDKRLSSGIEEDLQFLDTLRYRSFRVGLQRHGNAALVLKQERKLNFLDKIARDKSRTQHQKGNIARFHCLLNLVIIFLAGWNLHIRPQFEFNFGVSPKQDLQLCYERGAQFFIFVRIGDEEPASLIDYILGKALDVADFDTDHSLYFFDYAVFAFERDSAVGWRGSRVAVGLD